MTQITQLIVTSENNLRLRPALLLRGAAPRQQRRTLADPGRERHRRVAVSLRREGFVAAKTKKKTGCAKDASSHARASRTPSGVLAYHP